jgi:hypothetical protein
MSIAATDMSLRLVRLEQPVVSHIVLLGDSIFDNAAYVPGEPAVIDQLRLELPAGSEATLCAVDGDVTPRVHAQLRKVPKAATHLVVSVGGNDALGFSHITRGPSAPAAHLFDELAKIQAQFRRHYGAMLQALLELERPCAACTIYDAIPGLDPGSVTALSIFNDVILRGAFEHGLPVIDLRLVCSDADDYSPISPIEPSATGGAKIAKAIARVVAIHDFSTNRAAVYGLL